LLPFKYKTPLAVPPVYVGWLVYVTTCVFEMLMAVVGVPPAVVVCNCNTPSLPPDVFSPAEPLVAPLSERMIAGIIYSPVLQGVC